VCAEFLPARLHAGRFQRPVEVRPVSCHDVFGENDAGAWAEPHGDLHGQQNQLKRVRLWIRKAGQQFFGLRIEQFLRVPLEERHQFGWIVLPKYTV
jgi:hypothetical protein